jgi:hypothetical protein
MWERSVGVDGRLGIDRWRSATHDVSGLQVSSDSLRPTTLEPGNMKHISVILQSAFAVSEGHGPKPIGLGF